MSSNIPKATIESLARSIVKEASAYGFQQVDAVRLVNELLDAFADESLGGPVSTSTRPPDLAEPPDVADLPLQSEKLRIRAFEPLSDAPLLRKWLPDKYGRYFVLSCATARSDSIDDLYSDDRNLFGVITLHDGTPIGSLAFLDYRNSQKRAELRKLIGEPEFRGRGLAEEATRLWIDYGFKVLGLDKVYVSTLQTHFANIRLNERIGFKVEGLLRNEVLIDGARHDVLRMGISRQ